MCWFFGFSFLSDNRKNTRYQSTASRRCHRYHAAADSTYLGAAISAADGTFVLEPETEDYQLIVQHLLYQTRQVKGQARDAGIITLEQKDYNLDEVVVEGGTPVRDCRTGKTEL